MTAAILWGLVVALSPALGLLLGGAAFSALEPTVGGPLAACTALIFWSLAMWCGFRALTHGPSDE